MTVAGNGLTQPSTQQDLMDSRGPSLVLAPVIISASMSMQKKNKSNETLRTDEPMDYVHHCPVWHKSVCTVHCARGVFTASPGASVHIPKIRTLDLTCHSVHSELQAKVGLAKLGFGQSRPGQTRRLRLECCQSICHNLSRRLSIASNAARSMSRTKTFVVTRVPASLHTCAAATSRGKPLRLNTPASEHGARWWPGESSWRPLRQVREDRGKGSLTRLRSRMRKC